MRDDKQPAPICFVAANIWLYAFIADQDAGKSASAQRIVARDHLVVSTQVINEVCANLIKKTKIDEARLPDIIETFYRKHTVVQLNKNTLLKASELRERYQFSFWDSLIVACVLAANATLLYSEDMDTSLTVEGRLRIANPLVH